MANDYAIRDYLGKLLPSEFTCQKPRYVYTIWSLARRCRRYGQSDGILKLTTHVNSKLVQEGTTADMIFGIADAHRIFKQLHDIE